MIFKHVKNIHYVQDKVKLLIFTSRSAILIMTKVQCLPLLGLCNMEYLIQKYYKCQYLYVF